ncbi:unnamed protein product, partial [Effrenium voratum]
ANQLQMSGNIKDGSVWFLKGAARVTTAIAAVVALDKLNLEVGKGFSGNEDVAKQDKIVGHKQQAVKNILELPEPCRVLILDAVSVHGWESIMEILNELAPAAQKKSAGATDSSLQDASVALDAAQYKMVLEEIGYDEQCLQVFQEKISNYQVRMMHLQDSWVDKQLKTAREAISKWWEANVCPNAWPSKFDSGSALQMLKDLESYVALLFVVNYAAPSLLKVDDGVSFDVQTALMVVDTTPLVGNFLEAFIDISSSSKLPDDPPKEHTAAKPVTVAAGAVLSGFGKGKFRHVLPDAPLNEDKEVVFDCAPENYCMVDGKLHTFAEMLHDLKKKQPGNVKVCYHKVTQDPSGAWKIEKDSCFCLLKVMF